MASGADRAGTSGMSSNPTMEPRQPGSEVRLVLVFKHALTHVAGQGKFSQELLDKLQAVQKRKSLMLEVDPRGINIADVKAFVLHELQMTDLPVQMAVILEKKIILDTVFISELIQWGVSKRVGAAYSLEYTLLPAETSLPIAVDQQNGLLKQADPAAGCHTTPPPAPIPPSNPTVSPPEPSPPSPEIPVPVRGVDVPSPQGSSAAAPSDGEVTAPAATRKRRRPQAAGAKKILDSGSALPPPPPGMGGEPGPKRRLVWVPPAVPRVAARGVSVGEVVNPGGSVAPAHVFASGYGQMANGTMDNIPVPVGFPVLQPKPISPQQPSVQLVPVPTTAATNAGQRFCITTRQLALMSQLAVGHRKVTITFEDERGNVQTVCVENRA